jgi:hypothetical protein
LLSPPLPLPLPLHFPRPRPLPRPPSSASFALMVNCFCRVAVSLVSCPAEQKMGSQKVEVWLAPFIGKPVPRKTCFK